MYKKLQSFFKREPPEEKKERVIKELLRENLSLIPLDLFYGDDPVIELNDTKRKKYLKKFYDIVNDKEIMERFIYIINKQVRITMQKSKDGTTDTYGAININGIATVKDDFERLANMYSKEDVPEKEFNKFNVI